MSLDINRYTITLADPGLTAAEAYASRAYKVYEAVPILHQDSLRAEIEGPRLGLGTSMSEAPLHYVTLWCWAALARVDASAVGDFRDFKPRVIDISAYKGDPETPDELGPTRPEGDTSLPSSLLRGSEEAHSIG